MQRLFVLAKEKECYSQTMNQLLTNLVEELNSKSIPHRIVELSHPAMTVPEVKEFAKEPIVEHEVCKTIMILTNNGAIGIMLQGNRKIDFKKLRAQFGKTSRFATAKEVKAAANVEPGAVCPLLLNVPLYIDKSVVELQNAHFGSGDHMFGLEMRPVEIKKFARAMLCDFAL